MTPEPVPPPFKDVRYQSQVELQRGGAYAVSEEEFEDWTPQVGPTPHHCRPFITFPDLTSQFPLHRHTLLFSYLMKNPLLLPVLSC